MWQSGGVVVFECFSGFFTECIKLLVIFVSGAPFCWAKVGKEKLTASPARVSKRDSINLGFLNCLPLLSLGSFYFYYLPADPSPCPFGKCFGILQGIFHSTLPSGVLTGPVDELCCTTSGACRVISKLPDYLIPVLVCPDLIVSGSNRIRISRLVVPFVFIMEHGNVS